MVDPVMKLYQVLVYNLIWVSFESITWKSLGTSGLEATDELWLFNLENFAENVVFLWYLCILCISTCVRNTPQ